MSLFVGNVPQLNLENTNVPFMLTSKAPLLGGLEFPMMMALGACFFICFDTRSKSGW